MLGKKSKGHTWCVSKELDKLARKEQEKLGFPSLESYLKYKLGLSEFDIKVELVSEIEE
jgi:hypothetical protein